MKSVHGKRSLNRILLSAHSSFAHAFRRSIHIQSIRMPSLSPTMQAGTLLSWKKQVGDSITGGDVFCEVQTDKATMEFENVSEKGFLARVLVADGTPDVPVGKTIALLVENAKHLTHKEISDFIVQDLDLESKNESDTRNHPIQNESSPVETDKKFQSSETDRNTRFFVSPYAKTLARELGVNYAKAIPTGGEGPQYRITADDVRRLHARQLNKSSPTAEDFVFPEAVHPKCMSTLPFISMPVTEVHRAIARRLSYAQSHVPQFTIMEEVCMEGAYKLIEHYRKEKGARLSVNDYIVKAVAQACLNVPEANTHWESDTEMRRYDSAHVSIAVATPAGVLAPVLRSVDKKTFEEISCEIRALALKARQGSLTPSEMSNGTITVSNLGGYGTKAFTAMLNSPQSVIVAVGRVEWRPVIDQRSGEMGNRAERFLSLCVTFDHRVIDGDIGARFVKYLRGNIETSLEH